jgi:hypothetical protein
MTVLPAAEQVEPPVLGQLNTTLGRQFDGAAQFAVRPFRLVGSLSALAAAVLGFAAIRSRRLELAAAQHLGVTHMTQIRQMLLETACWVGLACALVLPLLSLASNHLAALSTDQPAMLMLAVRSTLSSAFGALAGAAAQAALIREHHLFRYFKHR